MHKESFYLGLGRRYLELNKQAAGYMPDLTPAMTGSTEDNGVFNPNAFNEQSWNTMKDNHNAEMALKNPGAAGAFKEPIPFAIDPEFQSTNPMNNAGPAPSPANAPVASNPEPNSTADQMANRMTEIMGLNQTARAAKQEPLVTPPPTTNLDSANLAPVQGDISTQQPAEVPSSQSFNVAGIGTNPAQPITPIGMPTPPPAVPLPGINSQPAINASANQKLPLGNTNLGHTGNTATAPVTPPTANTNTNPNLNLGQEKKKPILPTH